MEILALGNAAELVGDLDALGIFDLLGGSGRPRAALIAIRRATLAGRKCE
jgi:hypothetical protein